MERLKWFPGDAWVKYQYTKFKPKTLPLLPFLLIPEIMFFLKQYVLMTNYSSECNIKINKIA